MKENPDKFNLKLENINSMNSNIIDTLNIKSMRIAVVLCVWVALTLFLTLNANAKGGLPVWDPPGSYPVGFDWIQLNSGEWLKGDLKVLYDHSLEFDSDELGLLYFDWEDVYQVICHQVQSVRMEIPGSGRVGIFKLGGKVEEIVG